MPKTDKQKEFDKEAQQSDVLDLMRKVVDGLPLSEITYKELEGEERLEFLKYCSMVASDPYFERVFQMLYVPQIMAAATKAENYETVTFHRATANGISLVREFFQKQNRRFHEDFEKENKGFDEGKPFESSDADEFYKVP